MDGQRGDVVLAHALPTELPHELPRVGAGDLEDAQATDVGEDGVAHGGREVVELGEALGGEDEACAELAELGEHGLVVDAGHGLHLVDDDEGAAALRGGKGALLPDDGVDEVEEGGARRGRPRRARRFPGRWRPEGCRRRGSCCAGRRWSAAGRGWPWPASTMRSRTTASGRARGRRPGSRSASCRSHGPTSR